MLQQYVEEVPEVAYDILKYATKATTIIYDRPLRVAENLIAEDNTLGIRVARDPFCSKLIRKFKDLLFLHRQISVVNRLRETCKK